MVVLAPGSILFKLIDGDSHYLPGLEVVEAFFEGESAEDAEESGFFEEFAIENSTSPPTSAGWWIVDHFRVSYSKDYWGEVDTDFEVSAFRRATKEDLRRFGAGDS